MVKQLLFSYKISTYFNTKRKTSNDETQHLQVLLPWSKGKDYFTIVTTFQMFVLFSKYVLVNRFVGVIRIKN